MYASPRISSSSGMFLPERRSGRFRRTKALRVMSSPIAPSPRVRSRASLPRSYTAETPAPSTFGSTQYLNPPSAPKVLCRRESNSSSSAESNTLSRLFMGAMCATDAKDSVRSFPTARVGEDSSANCGYFSSNSRSLRTRTSKSSSEITGAFSMRYSRSCSAICARRLSI